MLKTLNKTFELVFFALVRNPREVPTAVSGCDGLTTVYITGGDSIRPSLSHVTQSRCTQSTLANLATIGKCSATSPFHFNAGFCALIHTYIGYDTVIYQPDIHI